MNLPHAPERRGAGTGSPEWAGDARRCLPRRQAALAHEEGRGSPTRGGSPRAGAGASILLCDHRTSHNTMRGSRSRWNLEEIEINMEHGAPLHSTDGEANSDTTLRPTTFANTRAGSVERWCPGRPPVGGVQRCGVFRVDLRVVRRAMVACRGHNGKPGFSRMNVL